MVLCMDGVKLSADYRQKFLVFIWSNSGGGKTESTLGPLSGFEPWAPAEWTSPLPLPSPERWGGINWQVWIQDNENPVP